MFEKKIKKLPTSESLACNMDSPIQHTAASIPNPVDHFH